MYRIPEAQSLLEDVRVSRESNGRNLTSLLNGLQNYQLTRSDYRNSENMTQNLKEQQQYFSLDKNNKPIHANVLTFHNEFGFHEQSTQTEKQNKTKGERLKEKLQLTELMNQMTPLTTSQASSYSSSSSSYSSSPAVASWYC